MKNRIKILLLFISIATAVIFAIFYGNQKESLPIGSQLPSIRYYSLKDSGQVKIIDKPIMIMFFKPDCPYCEYEFEIMNDRWAELQEITMFFLTTDKKYIRDSVYYKWKNLSKKDRIIFAYIDKAEFKSSIEIRIIPLFLFYGCTGTLIEKIGGETKFDRILGSINKAGGAQHQ